ncbi:MAG TPA: DUF2231 domain-containing protein [Gemmatimonadales bacterium]|nr:DUF2231 domain-containing protein [Gemmatimonadales bacterium]
MFGYDWAKLHALLNDFPAALLTVAVFFEWLGWLLKRETIRSAGLWTLWAGVVGGWAAVIAGLQAEDAIEHGEAIHELMDQHETWALVTMGIFTAILVWHLVRRGKLPRVEQWILRVVSLFALAILVRVGMLGGEMVFDHAAGVPMVKMEAEIKDRQAGHHHHPGEADEDHDHDEPTPPDTAHGHQ